MKLLRLVSKMAAISFFIVSTAAAIGNVSGDILNIRFNPAGNVCLTVRNSSSYFLWFPGNTAFGKNLLAAVLTARANGMDNSLNFRYVVNPTNNSNQSGACAGFEPASTAEAIPDSGWTCNEILFVDYLK